MNIKAEIERRIGENGYVIVQQLPEFIEDVEKLSGEAQENHQSGTAIFWDALAELLKAIEND